MYLTDAALFFLRYKSVTFGFGRKRAKSVNIADQSRCRAEYRAKRSRGLLADRRRRRFRLILTLRLIAFPRHS